MGFSTIRRAIRFLCARGCFSWMDDKCYLEMEYWACMDQRLRLKHPTTFNEKLQWLKLYDRKPEYTRMVDKVEAKQYAAERIGEAYLIPTLGVWDRFDDIDFDLLPDQFVLKCTHDSGGVVIVKDRAEFDRKKARAEIERALKRNYFYFGREWPYKNVRPRILAEKYMEHDSLAAPEDYKIHCFHGEPKIILVCRDRYTDAGLTEDFYTPEWEHLAIKRPGRPNAIQANEKPAELEKMLELAGVLSQNIPFTRVDFYIVRGRIYFGELTFYPASGMERFEPEKYDAIFGKWLEIPAAFDGQSTGG